MGQRAESIPVCQTCRHSKESHKEEEAERVAPDLTLRTFCLARGCNCTHYTGVLWESPVYSVTALRARLTPVLAKPNS